MDPRAWSAEPPVGPGGAPPGVPGQGQIELFRLVRVRGIFGHGAKQKNAAGDLGAQERAPAADPFAPAVILEKTLAEIGARIGLPPIHFARQRRDGLNQRASLRRRETRQAFERGNNGKRAGGYRTRAQIPRPVAKKRLSLGARLLNPSSDGVDERAEGFLAQDLA